MTFISAPAGLIKVGRNLGNEMLDEPAIQLNKARLGNEPRTQWVETQLVPTPYYGPLEIHITVNIWRNRTFAFFNFT